MDAGRRPLVICYGNPLRSDDGVAWHVAEALAAGDHLGGAELRCCHQLTPELAEDVSRAARVVLVDAAVGRPGTVQHTSVPATGRPATATPFSHGLTPGGLRDLAAALYGPVPPMDVVTVAAACFAAGEELSAPVAAAVAGAAAAVVAIVSADSGGAASYRTSSTPSIPAARWPGSEQ